MTETHDDPRVSFDSIIFVCRAKLPPVDFAERSAFIDAVFAAKPAGFEVSWPKENHNWVIDDEGFTHIPLYVTDHKLALFDYIERSRRLKQSIDDIERKIKEVLFL